MQISVNYKGTDLQFEQIPTQAQILHAYERHRANQRSTPARPVQQSIPRAARDLETPLSFAQQRVWFLNLFEPDSSYYNVSFSVRMKGQLDVEIFRRTLEEIISRHEVLRTTFPSDAGRPVQIIAPSAQAELTVADFSHLPEVEREFRAIELATEKAGEPFDLAQGPLFRANLIKLDIQVHLLTLTLHHIVSDGWSLQIIIRELAQIYNAFSREESSPLAELPIQYADFAVWQRQVLKGKVLDEHLSYWRQKLGGTLPVLQLPADHARPAVQTFRGARQIFSLGRSLTQQIKLLSRREGVTLYMTLLAAFSLLLHRYSGQEDILIGTPVANRNQVELEGLIGIFTNTLVLRTDLSGNPTFRQLLKRVRETALGAYAHQDAPFEKLVELLRPDRDLSRTPLFQVMLNLVNVQQDHSTALEQSELSLELLEVETGTAQFDLNLSINDGEDGLNGSLEYTTDLFDATTIQRMTRNFRALLESVVSDADQPISATALLSKAERQHLLSEWNDTATAFSGERCVHKLFAEQAAAAPDRIALSTGEEQLSYRELNEGANQLARYLQRLGVGEESLVGLVVERSPEMLIGLLGVLKAGAAYLPLDPDYPQSRLSFMIEDAQVKVLLTQSHLVERVAIGPAKVVCLDRDWAVIGREERAELSVNVAAEQLAYSIYTSGSTGGPKGVMISHGALTNFLHSMAQQPGLTASDQLLAVTTLSFDIAGLELYLPLIVGARVELVGREELLAPAKLRQRLAQSTVMQATPSLWRMLVESGEWRGQYKLLSGGEALPRQLGQQLLERSGAVWNMYGPTETTIWSSVEAVSRNEAGAAYQSLGRPIANTQFYVLDQRLEPVPVGVSGELYIGGAGVARGYLRRPELTAARFLPDGWSRQAGGRCYNTGDGVRYLADGRVEYLGRVDQQVKVRGHRIELGEIESVLCEREQVRAAVVAAREGASGQKQLVAYVVADVEVSSGEWRSYLQARLPDYMVPGVFVQLAELPLTPNGKVDRRRLPEPQEQVREVVTARTAVEEVLTGIWSEVLGVECLDIHDNFFERGGHSLLAMQVISKVREAFQVEIPFRTLFESPTISEVAEAIEKAKGRASENTRTIVPLPRDTSHFPLSLAQQGQWSIDQIMAGNSAYNIPNILRLKGRLNVATLQQAVGEVYRRHHVLRTTFQTVNGNPAQVIGPAQQVSLPVIHFAQHSENVSIDRLALEEWRRPFDLASGPMIRASLIKLADKEHVVLFTMHHIVADGWSMNVLLDEVTKLYEAFSVGKPSPLAELPLQYVDYAAWQRQWLQGETLRAELGYWKDKLANVHALKLPADRPHPILQSFRGAQESLMLSSELCAALKSLSRHEGSTMYITLLTAFVLLLSWLTSQEDIVLGSPIANRSRAGLDKLIGLFVNMMVMRTDVSGNPTFRELLARVREVSLGAYAHHELPFEQLVKELQPARNLSQTPLFQVVFVLEDRQERSFSLPELTIEPVDIDNGSAQIDLTLRMRETPEGLHSLIRYNSDVYSVARINRLLRLLEAVLLRVVAEPESRLDEFKDVLNKLNREQQSNAAREFSHNRLQRLNRIPEQRTPLFT
jgi:amino acid adenylation domain-containing protein